MAKKKPDKHFDLLSVAISAAKDLNISVTNSSVAHSGWLEKPVTTGLLSIDYMLRGGFPRSRFHLLYGPRQSCKSTLAYMSMGQAQIRNELTFLYDAEHGADVPYLNKMGVDTSRTDFIYIEPLIGEDVFKHLCVLLRDKVPQDAPPPFVIIDSLAALIPEAVAEDFSDAMGSLAQLLSKWLKLAVGVTSKRGGVLIAINQIREAPLKGEYLPGGNAAKFLTNVEYRVSAKKGDDTSHINVFFNLKKARHVHPFQTTDLKFYLGEGFDRTLDAWKFALASGQAAVAGGWYKMAIKGLKDGVPTITEGEKGLRWGEVEKALIEYNLYEHFKEQLQEGTVLDRDGESNAFKVIQQEGVQELYGELSPEMANNMPTMTDAKSLIEDGRSDVLKREVDDLERKS